MKTLVLGLCIVCLSSFGYSKTLGGLILTGLDSIYTKNQVGFDLNYEISCANAISSSSCFNHFKFLVDAKSVSEYNYQLTTPSGFAIRMYKMNLDSVKTAPADSIFSRSFVNYADTIAVDSLASRIGNVYLFRTDVDPRDGVRYHAKIKILNIAVKDSAKHQVVFKFLYAVQIDGSIDLGTTNLDTFHLGPTSTINSISSLSSTSIRQSVFKVFGNTFVMPQELVETNAMLTLYDLKGRKLGILETQGQKVVDVRNVAKGNGVVVVRVGKGF
jgi:hypothetical protein